MPEKAAERCHLPRRKRPPEDKSIMLLRHVQPFPIVSFRDFITGGIASRQDFLTGFHDLVTQHGKNDIQGDVFVPGKEIPACTECLTPGTLHGIAEDPR